MKTKTTFLLLLLSATLSQVSNAQEKSAAKLRTFGIGLNLHQFRFNDIISDVLPANNFILSINASDNLRIEPEFGILSITDKNDPDSSTDDLKISAFQFGLGIYYMFQKENLNMFTGALVESHSVSEENFENNYPYAPVKVENKTSLLGFGPVIGGEYLFGKHFSFGGKLALLFSSTEYDPQNGTGTESTTTYTSTSLQVRFYF